MLFFAAVAAVLVVSFYSAFRRMPEKGWRTREARIPRGATPSAAAKVLADSGLLYGEMPFRVLSCIRGPVSGRYVFVHPPSAVDVWRRVSSGDVARFVVTVPTGSTLKDVSRILEDMGAMDGRDFLREARSKERLSRVSPEAGSIEGFIPPGDYLVEKGMPPSALLDEMTNRFHRSFTSQMRMRAERMGMSVFQVVTIASIVEKEAVSAQEKRLIPAIIGKRIALGMPLQMDSTVAYGAGKPGGRVSGSDLRRSHPYNTYMKKGLPPGPISNPGSESIKATLYPEDRGYLYFVSKGDGTHEFSRTYREHKRAVEKLRESAWAEPGDPAPSDG